MPFFPIVNLKRMRKYKRTYEKQKEIIKRQFENINITAIDDKIEKLNYMNRENIWEAQERII